MLLREGTMQGDPLPMPMYALALVPIINCLHGLIKQVWYADDAAAAGLLAELRAWWDMFVTLILNMAILSTPLKLFWLSRKNIWYKLAQFLWALIFNSLLRGNTTWALLCDLLFLWSLMWMTRLGSELTSCLNCAISLLHSQMLLSLLLFMEYLENGLIYPKLYSTLLSYFLPISVCISCPPWLVRMRSVILRDNCLHYLYVWVVLALSILLLFSLILFKK